MWEQSENGRVTHPFEPLVLVATLALIPVLIIEYDVSSGGWLTFAKVANWVIWGIFAAEFAFILYVAPRKKAALRAHWLDAAIVVVSVPIYGKLLSSLRSVRLFRLLRVLRAGVVISRALQAERRMSSGSALRAAALATIFLTVLAGRRPINRRYRRLRDFLGRRLVGRGDRHNGRLWRPLSAHCCSTPP